MVEEKQFRQLPSVDKVLSDERITALETVYPHALLVNLARQRLENARRAIVGGGAPASLEEVVLAVIRQAEGLGHPTLRPVINATGVLLHTNLGRAPLSREAIAAMEAASRGYTNLELDLESGKRGSRQVHIEPLLCQLTGAEAALVVNSNAAAVLIGLTAIAKRKKVIVSRGEAVEIGDNFRIPDVIRQSGAKLVEVGTTNCTYARDYEQAVTPQTAALMRVHSSNFKVIGFTHSVAIEELAAVAGHVNLPLLDDQGSGCFLDTTAFGLAPEPMVQQSVAAGAGLVFFSGDKLVGGPQAGIIVGKGEYMDKLRKHPLLRAVRPDKIRIAGLAATLLHYLKGEAVNKIPVWQMIAAPLGDIERRARKWAEAVHGQVVEGESMVGGGSLPGSNLPTRLVSIAGGGRKDPRRVERLAQKLRSNAVPIIGRVGADALLLDPRSVLPEEDSIVIAALKGLEG